MRRSQTIMLIVVLLAGTPFATAGEITIAPLVGFSTGLTVQSLENTWKTTLEPAPEYGLIGGYSIGPQRWIEVLWIHQDMKFCDDCLPDNETSLGLNLDSIHLGGVYRPGTKKVRPYATASAGVTIYNSEASGQDTIAGFSFALGGGIDILLSDRLSLRLDGRGWLNFASGTLYGGCGGGCAIGFSGTGYFQIQGFAALVIRFP